MRCATCGASWVDGVCPRGHLDGLEALTVRASGSLDVDAAPTEPAARAPDEVATRIAADPLLPDVIGGFRLDYVAGTGGMGTLYRAHDVRLGTPVALKVMRRSAGSDEHLLQRAVREATAAALVQSPAIPPLLGHGVLADGRPWLATPFFEGAGLDVALAELGRLDWRLVVPVLGAVATALRAAHAVGVVHRDVKPANVFLARQSDGSVSVKLIDFGLALLGDAETGIAQTNVQFSVGTAAFSAPEQALGQAVHARSDLYALGVTAFQLLSGQLPFTAARPGEVLRQQVLEAPPKLAAVAQVPGPLSALVERLLAKRPADRPASAAEVLATLEELSFVAPSARGRCEAEVLLLEFSRGWARAHAPRSWLAQVRSWWSSRGAGS